VPSRQSPPTQIALNHAIALKKTKFTKKERTKMNRNKTIEVQIRQSMSETINPFSQHENITTLKISSTFITESPVKIKLPRTAQHIESSNLMISILNFPHHKTPALPIDFLFLLRLFVELISSQKLNDWISYLNI
jgi:hypothetical protein